MELLQTLGKLCIFLLIFLKHRELIYPYSNLNSGYIFVVTRKLLHLAD